MLSEENSINVYVGSNMNPAFCCLFVLGGQAQSWSQSRFWSLSASQVSITNSVFGVFSTTSVKQTSSGQTPEKLWLLFCCAVETCPEFSSIQFSSVQSQSCLTFCDPMNHNTQPPCPSPTPRVYPNSCPLSQWCHLTISFSVVPSSSCLHLSQHQGLFKESALHIRWPKYWSFSFNISPSNEHPGLIFFRMDWLDLLAVQETLKGLLQYHSSKASILQCSAFFTV